jgi:hypothetical protein
MVGVIETPAKLMEQWEAALKLAAETGYWADVYACGRVIEAFHDQIAKLLKPGTFSLSLVMSTGSSSVTPNRVSKRAPEFILLAEEMTEKLNAAFEQFESRPSWWTE